MTAPGNLVSTDTEANNGIVHVTDQVMTTSVFRYDLLQALETTGRFALFLELLVLTDLVGFVRGEGPFTAFVPSDDAFESHGSEFVESLREDPAGTRLLLLNHIVPDAILPCCGTSGTGGGGSSGDPGTEYTSASGSSLVVTRSEDRSSYVINDTVVTLEGFTNILTTNAKFYGIADVLRPPEN